MDILSFLFTLFVFAWPNSTCQSIFEGPMNSSFWEGLIEEVVQRQQQQQQQQQQQTTFTLYEFDISDDQLTESIPPDLLDLSDAQVLKLFNRIKIATNEAEINTLRRQLNSRSLAIRNAEDFAKKEGWSRQANSKLLVSEDFVPSAPDDWSRYADHIVPADQLSEHSFFGYRRGWFTVFIHGSGVQFSAGNTAASVEDLAGALKRKGLGQQPINLISCYAGQCLLDSTTLAQDLANRLKVPVIAADTVINLTYERFELITYNQTLIHPELEGLWQAFLPEN